MNVLIACEYSGIVRDAFAAKGHDAWSCDLLPTERPGNHIQGDVLEVLSNGWDLMIAHPPCTFLTVAANRWHRPEYAARFPTRNADRKEAVEFFMKFAEADVPRIAIENPIGVMSTIYRKPDQVVQPYYFGDDERKATCLWLKGLPKLVYQKTDTLFEQKTVVEPAIIYHASGRTDGRLHFETLKLSKVERAKARSKTFQGLADAMADQWG